MSDKRPVISLFSGAMGLDLGLEAAGFEIRVAVECNPFAAATIRANRPSLPLLVEKLEDVSTKEILKAARLEKGEPCLIIGGPSCQAFSTAGGRGSIGDPRGVMFREFLRVVKEARPRFFVMENVRGILSAAIKHRPLRERGPGYPPLEQDEEMGSGFALILKEIQASRYYTIFDLLNAADFGAPQVRERLVFIGSRDGEPLMMPMPTHARGGLAEGKLPWVSLRTALLGLHEREPAFTPLSPLKERGMKLIPEGGNWRDLPRKLQKEFMGGALTSWGGRTGFFRRLAWYNPTPALTTRPDSKATMFCHPEELRPLSVGDYARIQQFPDGWTFAGGVPQQYKQVGNAVPVGLGKAVGEAIRQTMRKRSSESEPPVIRCATPELMEKWAARPRTVLNPHRMRKVAGTERARKWLTSRGRNVRADLLDCIDIGDGPSTRPRALKRSKTSLIAARRARSK